MTQSLIQKFVNENSNLYRKIHFENLCCNKLLIKSDPWCALQFLFSKVFPQGRPDRLSEIIKNQIIDKIVEMQMNTLNFCSSEISKFSNKLNKLQEQKIFKGRKRDIEMTVQILHFINLIPDKNITKHSIKLIQEGQIIRLFEELDEIKSIGHKIASLYIRDLVSLFELNNFVNGINRNFLFPIDTWVDKGMIILKVYDSKTKHSEKLQSVINFCDNYNIEIDRLNEAIWISGRMLFEVRMEELAKEINN